MPLDVSRAPGAASPLWIIALFIALSEATAGVAAITTNGVARLVFACFAVSFPVVVFTIFVWLLIRHAPKLYAPGQYSSDITPEIYRLGLSPSESSFLGHAVAETVVPLLKSKDDGEDRREAVERVARRFEAAIERASVTVSLNQLKPGAEDLQIPVSERTNVDAFLDMIYFSLKPTIKPFTYNISWVLKDEYGKEYTDIGSSWARQGDAIGDSRPLVKVGILQGSKLEAVRKESKSLQRATIRQAKTLAQGAPTAI